MQNQKFCPEKFMQNRPLLPLAYENSKNLSNVCGKVHVILIC
jgi:hypothetical protein